MTVPFAGMFAGLYDELVKKGVPRDVAFAAEKAQLEHEGITDEQRKAHIPFVSEALQRTIDPTGTYSEAISKLSTKVFGGARGLGVMGELSGSLPPEMRYPNPSEDAWRMYLGMPQEGTKYGGPTFTISNFQPAHSTENKPYYALHKLGADQRLVERLLAPPVTGWDTFSHTPIAGDPNAYIADDNRNVFERLGLAGLMQHFKVSQGEDELGHYVSYYDKWDIDPGGLYSTIAQHVGKPLEIYDRIYYDPKTHEPIPESEILKKRKQLQDSRSQGR